jgi:tellurite resistance protein TerC
MTLPLLAQTADQAGATWVWFLFGALVIGAMAIDLGVFHRHAHRVATREALAWVTVWISLALAFNVFIWARSGSEKALEFLVCYVVEYSLSVDNIFVFVMIFAYFLVPPEYQHRVLFWGIIGAIVMRMIFIFAGIALLGHFEWLIYFFGGILVLTGVKFLREKEPEVHPERNPLLRLVRRFVRVTPEFHGQRFFTRVDGRLYATPLFLVLVVVEATDVVFAVDSVPAILGLTKDPLIAYTSNIFAILGLRAMYFVLAGIMDKFRYLKKGLSLVLLFIGAKMLAHDLVHVSPALSLLVVLGLLGGSVLLSLLLPSPSAPDSAPKPPEKAPMHQGQG